MTRLTISRSRRRVTGPRPRRLPPGPVYLRGFRLGPGDSHAWATARIRQTYRSRYEIFIAQRFMHIHVVISLEVDYRKRDG